MEIAMLVLAAVCLAQLLAVVLMASANVRTTRRVTDRLVVVAEKAFLEGLVQRDPSAQSRLAQPEPPLHAAPARPAGKNGTAPSLTFEDMPPGQSIGDN